MKQDDIPSRIIHFEDEFCVVTKFANENSQTDIPKIFEKEIKARLAKRNKKCEIISCPHRLDMCVAGIQIICFTKKSFTLFTQAFQNGQIHKTYWAIVENASLPLGGNYLENMMFFDTKRHKAYICDDGFSSDAENVGNSKIVENMKNTEIVGQKSKISPKYQKSLQFPQSRKNQKAKKATLYYKVFANGQNYSYLQVFPLTGRTHQIRVQLAKVGMHIKGDVKYSSRRKDTLPGIRLFARSIYIESGIFESEKTFSSELPFIDNLWQDFIDKEKLNG